MINWLKGLLGVPRDFPRYILVGGIPYTTMKGHETFLSLKKIGRFDTVEAAEQFAREKNKSYGGLFLVIDTEKM